MERMIEVCAGSYQDCIAAHQGSAKRVELNSALSVGGLTPSVASLIRVKKRNRLNRNLYGTCACRRFLL